MWRTVLTLCGLLCWGGQAAALELTPEEAAGKRLYLQGQSATGGEIHALVGAAGTPLQAALLPCGSCHGADGRGRPEGGVRPPDITWRRLSTPYGQRLDRGRSHPAYDEASFARAVSEGRDPAGNRLDPAMPRFVMSMRDMANLTAYLRRLEDDRDPGLHDTRLRVGTLLPREGPLSEHGRTVETVLEVVIEALNGAGGIHGRKLELVVADPGPDTDSAEAALRGLIEDDQVFALLAPLVPALEGRLADLLEPAGVPVVGPLAQFADGDAGRLIFTPLPGLREQLFALTTYASGSLEPGNRVALIAYPQGTSRQALAEALAARLRTQEWQAPRILGYRQETLAQELGEAAQGVRAVFFLGSQEDFIRLTEGLPGDAPAPYLFASAAQVAGTALQVPPRFSEHLFLAYPFLPSDWTATGAAALSTIRRHGSLSGHHAMLQVSAYCAVLLFSEGMKRAGRDASREKLVAALERLHGFQTGLTPELGFGPGLRTGTTGAHIVAVDLHGQRFLPVGSYIKVD
ncbi:ABC transporter substrate-binding protein [Zestomonas carbonaria]|uniref:Cytochrome c domain-containing protein n=1 Tax=Zestomonas carbonaria TaxID=2762745 RepID=A0A7U7EPT4_9GAMM|nr:ABC transporter substrate-binding protein [Pseudomonas carbonaria]CAD5108978.1 hypothetical protein PSEWESI4_03274 [Pseudomonas carbonaria]